jgi:hypothetical protein
LATKKTFEDAFDQCGRSGEMICIFAFNRVLKIYAFEEHQQTEHKKKRAIRAAQTSKKVINII